MTRGREAWRRVRNCKQRERLVREEARGAETGEGRKTGFESYLAGGACKALGGR